MDNGQSLSQEEKINTCNSVAATANPRQNDKDVVSPNCVVTSHGNKDVKWFLMRAAYGQEKKAYEYLLGKEGICDVFYPQWLKERTYGGKRKKVMVSVLPNTLFVKSTQSDLHNYIGVPPLTYFHHYYQHHHDERGYDIENGRKPIVIPENQVLSFRKWLDADAEDKIYMKSTFTFKKDDLVRVTEGTFEGFTGHIVRLKGQTRVGVNIEGVGFISTTYIPKNCLELVRTSAPQSGSI